MEYLTRHLRAAGSSRWELIAEAAGVSKVLPRKIVYDERPQFGPGVLTVQPLLDYFKRVDAGEIALPEGKGEPAKAA